MSVRSSVTRFGDFLYLFLYFGQLYKAWGYNYFAEIEKTF